MYVEISGRQTGKTTRLVDNVITFLTENPDKSALIVSGHNDSRKRIQKMIYEKCGRPCEYRTITSHKMLPPIPNSTLKQFVDEFWCVKSENLVVDKKAYYTTTMDISFNEKGLEIWNVYRQTQLLTPNNTLKRHGFR
jgi:hypothetical protein